VGGTSWKHIGEYAGGVVESLEAVQREVFTNGDFEYFTQREVYEDGEYLSVEREVPRTFEEFWATEESSHPEGGTHSILDVHGIREPAALAVDMDTNRYYGHIYPLDSDETVRYFGTAQPTRADFERVGFHGVSKSQPARFMGRCVVLYADGQPSEVGAP
jgi:hypothetical protein